MNQEIRRSRLAAKLILVLAFVYVAPSAVWAVDGQVELNQAQATATGTYQTLVITQPGSYKLTSNLIVPDSRTGISIEVDDVTLDLNGFTIQGPGTGGSASGISSSLSNNSRVHNGTVRDFRTNCIQLGSFARVENVLVTSCGGDGITLQPSSRVRSSTSMSNSGIGIVMGAWGVVEDSVIQDNAGGQISLGAEGRVEGCTVNSFDPTMGIVVGNGAIVSNNTVSVVNHSGMIAITTGDLATIFRNVIRRTFGAASGGTAIMTGNGSVAEANVALNFTIGLQAGDGVIVRGNSFAGISADANGFGILVSGANGLSVVEENSLDKFTVGASLIGNARFAGNTVRSSGVAGSIGLAVSAGNTAIRDNVFDNFATNLQGTIVETGTNLYDGGTVP
jgi:hypothetical protein